MDHRETERFLDRLFEPGESFEVAYIKPNGPVRRVKRTIEPVAGSETGRGDVATLLAEMERAEESGFNVYVGVLPVEDQGVRYSRVWIDQDTPEAPWPFLPAVDWDRQPLPAPTTLVKTSETASGFRWQAIWRLTEPLSDEEGRKAVRRLADLTGGDPSVVDNRRVLRVPGIVNAKRGQVARLMATSMEETPIGAFDLPEESLVDKILATPVNNPQAILGEWLAGTEEGERNRKAYIVSRFLKSCEVEMVDAAAIVKLGASRCDPVLPDHEIEHAVKSAYHKA